MLAVCQACQFFLLDIREHHVLVRSDSRSVVSYINHKGGLVSKQLCTLANDLLVSAQEQSALNDGDACAGQNEPRSRHVVEEQCLFRGMDAPPAHGSENLGSLWQTTLSAQSFLQRAQMPCPTNGPAFHSMLSPQSHCYQRYSGELGNNGTS